VATLLAHQPVPLGNRVAILTDVDGMGVLAADACEAEGLIVGPLAESTRVALRRVLSPSARLANPGGDGGGGDGRAIRRRTGAAPR